MSELLDDKYGRRLIAEEVSFEVAENLCTENFGVDSKPDARVLSAEVRLGEVIGGRSVVRYRAEIRSDAAADVSRTSKERCVNETQRSERRVSNTDGEFGRRDRCSRAAHCLPS